MSQSHEDLAVVGVACLFPESDSVEEYWSLVKDGKDAIKEIPCSHWNPEDYYNEDPKAPDHTYGKTGAFLRTQKFDPLHYGISPQAVQATDTTQLLGMVVAERALENAGYGLDAQFDRDRVSCILGVTGTLEMVIPLGARLGHPVWRKSLAKAGLPEEEIDAIVADVSKSYVPWQEASFPGLLGNVVAGRIANRLNLGGSNSVADAACASSLAALRTAAMELQSGRSDMVITGGMDTFNDIFMYMCFSKTPALSPQGQARPFDAQGDGTVLGEGLGALVLKRRSDAERDGDRIYALIKGIGSSSDGRGQAIYAPAQAGQEKALRAAYQEANISPSTVQLVECHGTGTKLGDGIELSALKNVYRSLGGEGRWCTLGSVKSQIGHTKAAAGAAGIIKAVMALYHKVLPPTLKVSSPHEQLQDSPFILRRQASPWLSSPHHPRRAAVSAFGFGGSNFHCVLEEYERQKTISDHDASRTILTMSGGSREELLQQVDGVISLLPEQDLISICRDLRQGMRAAPLRLGILLEQDTAEEVLVDVKDALEKGADLSGLKSRGVYYGEGAAPGKLAVLFAGQGAQYPNMLGGLCSEFVAAHQSLSKAVAAHSHERLYDVIYPGQAFTPEEKSAQAKELARTDRAQSAIGGVSAGLWNVLQEFGVEGDMFAGHSFGELSALYAAGVYDEDTLHSLANIRGQLMAQAAPDLGGMMAIFASAEDVENFIREQGLDLVLANHNAPDQVVVAGGTEEIAKGKRALRAAGLKGKVLTVGAAFHSPIMKDTTLPFREKMEPFAFSNPKKPIFSNSLAAPYSGDSGSMKQVLSEQLAKPVRFVEQLEAMYDAGARTFLEVGPSRILSGLASKIFAGEKVRSLACDHSGVGARDLCGVLLELFSLGYGVDFSTWQTVWAPDPVDAPAFSLPVNGANYRPSPEEGEVIVRSKTNVIQDKESVDMSHEEKSRNIPEGGLAQHLLALQDMQKRNAQLHKQFLDNQAESQRIFAQLLGMYRGEAVSQPLMETAAVTKPVTEAPSLDLSQDNPKPTPLVEAVKEQTEKAPQPLPAVAASPEVHGASQGGDVSDLMPTLLSLIADKTGYPKDMLAVEMFLEEDLGIDSIKRVEIFSALQDQFPQLMAADADELGALKSIQDIFDFLAKGSESDSSSGGEVVAEEPISASEEVSLGAEAELTEGTLLQVIAEKTGYPSHMLHLEMELDSDLGIDSIKRVEIFSALGEHYPQVAEASQEDLSELATIADVLAFLSSDMMAAEESVGEEPEIIEAANSSEAKDAQEGAAPIVESKPETAPTQEELPPVMQVPEALVTEPSYSLPRQVLVCEDFDELLHSEQALQPGAKLWVCDDGSNLARNIVLKLKERKFKVRLVSTSFVDRLKAPEELDGLLILGPMKLDGSPSRFLANAFKMVRLCGQALKSGPNKLLAVVTRNGGHFGLEGLDSLSQVYAGALAGLSKTVRQEWSDIRSIHVDLARDFSDGFEAASRLIEACLHCEEPELGVFSKHYSRPSLVNEVASESELQLTSDDLVVITGGGRGVTAQLAIRLAKKYQPQLAIWGRTPLVEDLPEWVLKAEGEADLKAQLMEREGISNPKDLQKAYHELSSQLELLANLKAMGDAGVKVHYQEVDVSNDAAIRKAIAETKKTLGEPTALIHGAGVLADKHIEDIDDDSFLRVIDTKTRLLKYVDSDLSQLKYLLLFSSSTARFGRKGQLAYGVANEALNKFASYYQNTHDSLRSVAINWGPWDGGMVHDGLKKLFEKEGIASIPLSLGVDFALAELAQGPSAMSEVVAVAAQDSAEDTAIEEVIDFDNWPVLQAHVLKGRGVVPSVILMELLVNRAKKAYPDLCLQGIEDFKVLKGIVLSVDQHCQYRISLEKASELEGGLQVQMTLFSQLAEGQNWYKSASALVKLGERPLENAPEPSVEVHALMEAPKLDDVYEEYLFHGEELQGLTSLKALDKNGIVGTSLAAPQSSQWLRHSEIGAWSCDPLVMDVAFQLGVVWSQKLCGLRSLPTGFSSLKLYREFPKEGCEVRLLVQGQSRSAFEARIEFIHDGQLIAEMIGYQAVMDEALVQSFKENTVELPPVGL